MIITNGHFKVTVTLRGPSMTIVESQIEVISKSFGTKYSRLSVAN